MIQQPTDCQWPEQGEAGLSLSRFRASVWVDAAGYFSPRRQGFLPGRTLTGSGVFVVAVGLPFLWGWTLRRASRNLCLTPAPGPPERQSDQSPRVAVRSIQGRARAGMSSRSHAV